jgi:two-component system chemotaxis sensor kinase CheA
MDRVEYANGRALLQYRGELLQLRDDGHVLDGMDLLEDKEASVTVLICGDPQTKATRMGIVVRKVLDVSDGAMLEKDAANGDMDLALVNERLTTIFHGFAGKVGKSWREVA